MTEQMTEDRWQSPLSCPEFIRVNLFRAVEMNDKIIGQPNYSLYLHIPFCTHRCGYCDFNTYARLDALIPAYVDALVTEARQLAASAGTQLPVHTIFFGGGTPSLLPVGAVEWILDVLRAAYCVSEDAEITLEANPGTLSLEKLAGLRQAGVNRLSFGVQSASPEELRLLERQHDFEDVIRAVKWARQAGFANLNLDWIYGLPGQSLRSWQRNIELAISLDPEHLSLYALSIEHGTPFKDMSDDGLLPLLDSDLAADMYEWASDRLETVGYMQYEISNWAKVGGNPDPQAPSPAKLERGSLDRETRACVHNLQYWRSLPYIGFGAGAHGFSAGTRTVNALAPAAYIQRMRGRSIPSSHQSPSLRSGSGQAPGGSLGTGLHPDEHEFPRTDATASFEKIDRRRAMGETMMMGLRLVEEGVSRQAFAERFGIELDEAYGPQIGRLQGLALLESVNGAQNAIRLTKRGRLLGNQVFMEFI